MPSQMSGGRLRRKMEFKNKGALSALFQALAPNKSELEKLGILINIRGNNVFVVGPEHAERFVSELYEMACKGECVSKYDVLRAEAIVASGESLSNCFDAILMKPLDGKPVKPRSISQRHYIGQVQNNSVAFGLGPAGVGKTWLAVAMAVKSYVQRDVRKIILTRPAVEAGEKLGFLPGTLEEKIAPYLRPLYDALGDMLPASQVQEMLQFGDIEIAPLAYMRGRTLDNAFILLDEAQNTTREQMKMFLTRLGRDSKMVITGDPDQVDLPNLSQSGLRHANYILRKTEGIGRTVFTSKDVMRHPMVARIVDAYDLDYKERRDRKEKKEK